MQSISSDKEDMEEAEMDLPVSCSFTDQAKQREIHQRKINKTIIENRIKTKALRKAKRNVRKQTDGCQSSEIACQEIQEKDYLEEEFNCPGYFNTSDHLQFGEDDGDQPPIQNKSQSLDISASSSPNENELLYGNESDEGYDGSEEHDKNKSKTILFDNIDSFTINTLKSKGSDFETRNHKSWKKINRLNGIHVRILDSANIENTARQRCDSFRKNQLYSSSYSGRYGDVKRVTPSLLRNLSRKKKARAGMR
ncbi:unnamed protein product [Schistosoma curassoni]|uniref:Uncharacterized protein n=1 Tax=Schistosoma curassoni TaxID=6186 RepID=A0A183KPD6_9TREM|nr:unnamed protein product [Schistosoma curassoni]